MHPLRRAVRHHRLKLDAEEALIESGLPYAIVLPMPYAAPVTDLEQGVRIQHPRGAFQHRYQKVNASLQDISDSMSVW